MECKWILMLSSKKTTVGCVWGWNHSLWQRPEVSEAAITGRDWGPCLPCCAWNFISDLLTQPTNNNNNSLPENTHTHTHTAERSFHFAKNYNSVSYITRPFMCNQSPNNSEFTHNSNRIFQYWATKTLVNDANFYLHYQVKYTVRRMKLDIMWHRNNISWTRSLPFRKKHQE